ncbi:hypothetical protein PP336_14505 [Mycobacteroides abscessus]|uniref:hypothetical protein n=1 Tax=Mycobacteroides abscessus TaxID=36809 RepID=UPI00078D7952|nr:hypothetical protein [Mycobacteroides abscessus]QSM04193.1 hypothetical protein PROPHIGD51-2_55 [Mycobacterium phage prophiGD51-2]AMU55778.1 hypothetical protein A3O02_11825 [Mycobacteroides abscessus]MBE5436462.1 hypothetical protein [Mycobacteroides abscessus]MBN7447548.1 hypothetical protein [Mycobacteroides abscessus subsp. abscessus]MDM1901620.1 hypothetical protein [Mycobacteroides abscessus]
MTTTFKPIPVTQENLDRLREAVYAAEGRATAFCVAPEDLADIAERAEKRLAPLPKALWTGTVVTYLPAGPWAKSYNGGRSVKATEVTLIRRSRDWALVGVERTVQHNGRASQLNVTLPPTVTQDVLVEYLLKDARLTLAPAETAAA